MRYELITQSKKYIKMNGYKAKSESPYKFLTHCSYKFNFDTQQLFKALKSGKVYVELTLS